MHNSIMQILGVQAALGIGKYLDRIRINSWSNKCLSKAGCEIMIKYVLQVILSYVMSVFLLPKTLIDIVEKMGTWWSNK